MVHFKKDKSDKKKELLKYVSTFISGFIIALFLILFILLFVMNSLRAKDVPTPTPDPSSSEPLPSSEPVSTSSESNSSSSSSEVDPYLDEKAIIDNLLILAKECEENIKEIHNINYDDDYLYVTALGNDHYLYVLIGELGDKSVDVILESLILSSDGFSFDSVMDSYNLEALPEIDITSLETFTSNDDFNKYSYQSKDTFYLDDSHDIVCLTAIGYYSNSYISLNTLSYDLTLEELVLPPVIAPTLASDVDSPYYQLLDYLYSR